MVITKAIKSSLTDVPHDIASKRWLFWISLCFAGIITFGSAVTVILGVLAIVAILLRFLQKDHFQTSKTEKIITSIILCYISIAVICSLLSPNTLNGIKITSSNASFLIFIALCPVVRYFLKTCWIDKIFQMISIGITISALIVLTQVLAFDAIRPHALAGNPLLLSMMAAGFSLFSLHKFFEVESNSRYLHILAFFFACIIIFITGSRAAMLALTLSSIVLFAFHSRDLLKNSKNLFQTVWIFFLLSILLYELLRNTSGFQYVIQRFDGIKIFTQYLFGNGDNGSIDARLEMMQGGLMAFIQAPWIGHGRQNIMQVTSDVLDVELIRYTHLHNAFITEMVSSGILGLVSILAVCFLPIYTVWHARPDIKILAIAWTIGWITIILTGIGFYHDITICYFCLILMFFHLLINAETI